MTGQTNEPQWYIARDGKQHGPLTDVEMRTFVAHNYLRPADLIWRPGMADWQPATTVFPGVFQPPMPSPAPVAPAPQQAAPPQAAPAPQTAPTMQPGQPISQHGELAIDDYQETKSRGVGRQLALAALALSLIGGGAYAIATYREPLMKIVSGPPKKAAPASEDKAAEAKPPAGETENKQEMKTAALDPTAPQPAAPPVATIENSALDQRLQKIPAWELIKKNYPDWYANHIAAADKLAAEKQPESTITTHLVKGLVSLRKQNADKTLSASPEKLKRVATAFLDNLKALQAQSVEACYGYISKGEMSPVIVQIMQTPENAASIHANAFAIFEAAAEGAQSPTKHESAVKADYDLLIKELAKIGWSQDDLQVFSNPRMLAKKEPAQVCKMVQDWFVAHLAVEDAAAQDRLLFETLKPVVSG